MKKRVMVVYICIAFLAAAFGIFFYKENIGNSIVTTNRDNTPKIKERVSGTDMFTDEYMESVNRIDFLPFDESESISIKGNENINEFFEILRNEEYEPVDEKEWVEGGYMFNFITKEGVESFTVGGNVIVFDAAPDETQYYAVSGNDLVKGIIKETVNSVK